MVLATDRLSQLNAFLQVQIYLLFVLHGSKAEPSCHPVVLDLFCGSFIFVELKCFGKPIHKLLCICKKMCLLLKCILKVN